MGKLRIDRLMVRPIREGSKVHEKLKTVWLKDEEDEKHQSKKHSQEIESSAEHNTNQLMKEIENGFLEGVKESIEQTTIDNETVLVGKIKEGVGKEKTEIPIVIRQMSGDYFEIYLPHAPEKEGGLPVWKNYLVERKLINRLFGIGVDFRA